MYRPLSTAPYVTVPYLTAPYVTAPYLTAAGGARRYSSAGSAGQSWSDDDVAAAMTNDVTAGVAAFVTAAEAAGAEGEGAAVTSSSAVTSSAAEASELAAARFKPIVKAAKELARGVEWGETAKHTHVRPP